MKFVEIGGRYINPANIAMIEAKDDANKPASVMRLLGGQTIVVPGKPCDIIAAIDLACESCDKE